MRAEKGLVLAFGFGLRGHLDGVQVCVFTAAHRGGRREAASAKCGETPARKSAGRLRTRLLVEEGWCHILLNLPSKQTSCKKAA